MEAVDGFFQPYVDLYEQLRYAGKHYKGPDDIWLNESFTPCSDSSYADFPPLLSNNETNEMKACELDVVSLCFFLILFKKLETRKRSLAKLLV